MRSPLGVLLFLSFMLVLDTYFFQAIKTISQSASPKIKVLIYSIYWALTILAVVGFILFVYTEPAFMGKKVRTYLFATILGLFLAKILALVFFVADDLRRGIQWLAGKLFFNNAASSNLSGDGITRSTFLSWLGVAAGSTLFGSLLYGFTNKYKYQVKRIQLAY